VLGEDRRARDRLAQAARTDQGDPVLALPEQDLTELAEQALGLAPPLAASLTLNEELAPRGQQGASGPAAAEAREAQAERIAPVRPSRSRASGGRLSQPPSTICHQPT